MIHPDRPLGRSGETTTRVSIWNSRSEQIPSNVIRSRHIINQYQLFWTENATQTARTRLFLRIHQWKWSLWGDSQALDNISTPWLDRCCAIYSCVSLPMPKSVYHLGGKYIPWRGDQQKDRGECCSSPRIWEHSAWELENRTTISAAPNAIAIRITDRNTLFPTGQMVNPTEAFHNTHHESGSNLLNIHKMASIRLCESCKQCTGTYYAPPLDIRFSRIQWLLSGAKLCLASLTDSIPALIRVTVRDPWKGKECVHSFHLLLCSSE